MSTRFYWFFVYLLVVLLSGYLNNWEIKFTTVNILSLRLVVYVLLLNYIWIANYLGNHKCYKIINISLHFYFTNIIYKSNM